MAEIQTDVCIIGSGPIGLTMAAVLARFGLRSVILEKRGAVNTHPRSRFVDSNTMELLRFLGIEQEVIATGLGPDWTQCNRWLTSLTGRQIAAISSPTFHSVPGPHSPTIPVMTCQDYLEHELLKLLERNDLVELHYRCEVTAVTQDAEGTRTAVLDHNTGRRDTVTAAFTIGADGPHSFARTAIGSVLEAEPRPYLMQDVIFEADLADCVGERKAALLYALTEQGVLIFQPLNGRTRWRCQIPRMDESSLSEPEVAAMIRLAAGALKTRPIEVVSTGMWRPTPGCVDCLGSGRIFLAGDAAHVAVPTGGMGNNIGFAGVRNLAWKLAYVFKGIAPAAILESYETEHRPLALARIEVGVRTTESMAGIFAAHYSGGDPAEAIARTQQYGDYDGALFGYELSSPLIAEAHEAPPAVDNATIDFVPAVRPGRRAPHQWLDRAAQRSLLDLFGLAYLLLLGSEVEPAPWQRAIEATEHLLPLHCVLLPPQTAPLYDPQQIVLVRPDGIIADCWPSDVTTHAQERLLQALPLAHQGAIYG